MVQVTKDAFEYILPTFNESQEINLQEVTFIDPYGLVGLLELGELFKFRDIRKVMYLPHSEEVLKYLERMQYCPVK